MEIDGAIEKIKTLCPYHCFEYRDIGCTDNIKSCEIRDCIDKAIESLKFQQEYQAKVQKCIERMKDSMKNEHLSIKGEPTDTLQKAFITTLHYAIEVIKEEMGVEE